MQYQEAGTLGNLVHPGPGLPNGTVPPPSAEAHGLLMMDNGVLHLNGDFPQ